MDTKAPIGPEVEPTELKPVGSRSQCEAFLEVILAFTSSRESLPLPSVPSCLEKASPKLG
jgi:hypothetical protein